MVDRVRRGRDGRPIVVAITGGARGIGRATARRFSEDGAHVAIGDLRAADAEQAAAELPGPGSGQELDVRDRASFVAFLEGVERELGPLDVLVNNAGIMPVGPFLEEPDALARRMFEVNVLGALTGMKLALPGMVRRGSGRVVNVASYAGVLPVPGQVTYAGTKAAVLAITEGARWELSRTGVGLTAVIPSFTNTELIAGTGAVRTAAPIEPEDVAAAIVRAVARGRDEVHVPGSVRPIGAAIGLLPRPVRQAVHALLGTDRAFLDLDAVARRAYDEELVDAPASIVTGEDAAAETAR